MQVVNRYYLDCNKTHYKQSNSYNLPDEEYTLCSTIVENQLRIVDQVRKIKAFLSVQSESDSVENVYKEYTGFDKENTASLSDFKRVFNRWYKEKCNDEFLGYMDSQQHIFIDDNDYINEVFKDYSKSTTFLLDFTQFVSKYSQYMKQFSFNTKKGKACGA